jgi:hypothetical protein
MLIGGLLGGCAVATGPPAGTLFDGSYTGQNTLIGGGGYLCGAPSYPVNLLIIGGRFEYPFAVNPPRTAPLPVQVVVDGTFSGQMQYGTENYLPGMRQSYHNAWVTITGRIAGDILDATIVDERCEWRLTARKG